MKRGQIAIEFILLTMLSIFVVLVLVVVGVDLTVYEFDEQREAEVLDLAQTIQEEFILSTEVQFGYHRIFVLPITLNRGDYTLLNDGSTVTIWAKGVNITVDVPPHQGNISKGKNRIVNMNGTIVIN